MQFYIYIYTYMSICNDVCIYVRNYIYIYKCIYINVISYSGLTPFGHEIDRDLESMGPSHAFH